MSTVDYIFADERIFLSSEEPYLLNISLTTNSMEEFESLSIWIKEEKSFADVCRFSLGYDAISGMSITDIIIGSSIPIALCVFGGMVNVGGNAVADCRKSGDFKKCIREKLKDAPDDTFKLLMRCVGQQITRA